MKETRTQIRYCCDICGDYSDWWEEEEVDPYRWYVLQAPATSGWPMAQHFCSLVCLKRIDLERWHKVRKPG